MLTRNLVYVHKSLDTCRFEGIELHMHNHQHYVPVLKWKQGEYQALSRLSDDRKASLTPLFELTPPGHDFETGTDRKTLDDHIKVFGKRLKSKWGTRRCFLDASLTQEPAHALSKALPDARENACVVIPVITLGSKSDFVSLITKAVKREGNGACLRLSWQKDFSREGLDTAIEKMLKTIDLAPSQVDLVVDFAAEKFEPIRIMSQAAATALKELPFLNRWRSLTYVGSSYPRTFAEVFDKPDIEFVHVRRVEWEFYKSLVQNMNTTVRIPCYGDYASAHPDLVELDMRLIKPFAKVRYTTSDGWHLGKGTNVRADGFEQFRGLCKTLIARKYFDGKEFSAADDYIIKCARGDESTGNLTTWVWVATNRHLSKVVDDLAKFHVS